MKQIRSAPLILLLATAALAQPCSPYWTGTGSVVRPTTNRSMTVFDDGAGPALYVAGRVQDSAGMFHYGVARWDGRFWRVLNEGLPPVANGGDLPLLHDGEALRLYWWIEDAVTSEIQLVYWSGTQWERGPAGFTVPNIGPKYSYHDGQSWRTYGLELDPPWTYYVLQWIDGQWVRLPGAFNGHVTRFAAYDDGSGLTLHVAGQFFEIDNIPVSRVARWTGSVWEPLGPGIYPGSTDMVVHDDGSGPALYLSNVISAGGVPMNGLARWDGHTWSDVGGSIQPVGIVTPHVLGSFDDGDGPALFIGGFMSVMGGGVPVRSIARYKDGVWDDMGGGVRGGYPLAMTVFDDGRGPSLFVGGDFHTVAYGAEGSARRIAQWVGCTNQCYADCDNSQVSPRLNIDDFTCFINKFAAGDPYADCNQDEVRDINDFTCFINRFAEQCR